MASSIRRSSTLRQTANFTSIRGRSKMIAQLSEEERDLVEDLLQVKVSVETITLLILIRRTMPKRGDKLVMQDEFKRVFKDVMYVRTLEEKRRRATDSER